MQTNRDNDGRTTVYQFDLIKDDDELEEVLKICRFYKGQKVGVEICVDGEKCDETFDANIEDVQHVANKYVVFFANVTASNIQELRHTYQVYIDVIAKLEYAHHV